MCFHGYLDIQKGFLCYDPLAHRIRISRNFIFLDNVYFYTQQSSSATSDCSLFFNPFVTDDVKDDIGIPTQETIGQPQSPSPPPAQNHTLDESAHETFAPPDGSIEPLMLRRSPRMSHSPQRYGSSPPHSQSLVATLDSVDIPSSYQHALNIPCWKKPWMHDNDSWELLSCPSDTTIIVSRWVFSVKLKVMGKRYKARLVAQGYKQGYGIERIRNSL